MHLYEEDVLQADAYIDALLAARSGTPSLLPDAELQPRPPLRQLIELLADGLPRFHPSFLFEEQLATRLRSAAMGGRQDPADLVPGDVLKLPVSIGGGANMPAAALTLDRRLLVGGAIASGVSLAGAAMLAWRIRERGRIRRRWLA